MRLHGVFARLTKVSAVIGCGLVGVFSAGPGAGTASSFTTRGAARQTRIIAREFVNVVVAEALPTPRHGADYVCSALTGAARRSYTRGGSSRCGERFRQMFREDRIAIDVKFGGGRQAIAANLRTILDVRANVRFSRRDGSQYAVIALPRGAGGAYRSTLIEDGSHWLFTRMPFPF